MLTVFDVDMRRKKGVRIGATGLEGLEQEIRTLLSTRKGSVPLDRDFGITWDYVDLPMPEAMPYMIAEIACQLEKYVPRIRVRDIRFLSDDPLEGILQPTVTVEIREKYRGDFRGEF